MRPYLRRVLFRSDLAPTTAKLTPRKTSPPRSIPPLRGSRRTSNAWETTVTAACGTGPSGPRPLLGVARSDWPATAIGIAVGVARSGVEGGWVVPPEVVIDVHVGGPTMPGVAVSVGVSVTLPTAVVVPTGVAVSVSVSDGVGVFVL
jgi:hypothetical protein